MIPEMQFEKLRNHLQEHGYGNHKDDGRNDSGNNIEIKFLDGEPGSKDGNKSSIC